MRLLFCVGAVLVWHRVQGGVPLSELVRDPLRVLQSGG